MKRLLPILLCACASAPQKKDEPVIVEPVVAVEEEEEEEEEDEEPALVMPKSFAQMAKTFEFICPVGDYAFDAPEVIKLKEHTFVVEGSRIVHEGNMDTIRFGVFSAPKDPTPKTVDNMKRAAKKFKKAKVDFVLVNGDLAEDAELLRVMRALVENFSQPVFIHSGNIEWTSTFSDSFTTVQKESPNLFNLNWVHEVDFGDIHLLVLPGYFEKKFTNSGACQYRPGHVAALQKRAEALRDKVVVVTSHGPPLQTGKYGLDIAEGAGHVGDPDLTRALKESGVRFGIFGHILEAGGRATYDVDGEKKAVVLKKKKKAAKTKPAKSLYVNVGTASAFPWAMLDNSSSYGMAAIYTVNKGKASVKFFRLR